MTTTCTKCNKEGSNLKKVDIPYGAVLCEKCFAEIVWKCDSCKNLIANSDVEDGEDNQGYYTPMLDEQWCGSCSDSRLKLCYKCLLVELNDDLISTPDGFLCKDCSSEDSSDSIKESPRLVRSNWKSAVDKAINDLPEKLKVLVTHKILSEDQVEVKVEQCSDIKEDFIGVIKLSYWKAAKDQGEFDNSFLIDFEMSFVEQAKLPSVSIEGKANYLRENLFLNFETIGSFCDRLQRYILEEIYSIGDKSLVSKDRKGQYTLEDGSRILNWK